MTRLLAQLKSLANVAHGARQITDDNSASVIPSPEVRASLQENGVVFLHQRSGTVFRSNRIGAAIWKGLVNRHDIATIVSQIGLEYGIPTAQAARDAAGFVSQLEAQGFLVRRAGA